MKFAVHHRSNSFSSFWIKYFQEKNIPYKVVDCYKSDIINQVEDCGAVMWHFHHTDPKDSLFAKELFYSFEAAGKIVFPDHNTAWHFDDKLGQKYLLESVDAPLARTYVFYEKQEAIEWIKTAHFPKVFKLRRGSGSSHVKLVKTKREARKFVKIMFGKGFSQYNARTNLQERWRKYRIGKTNFFDLIKGVIRIGYNTDFAKVIGNEKGYVYFQDFIAGNDHDIRVTVINGKAFAVRRMVRPGDFRASGSGLIDYDISMVPESVLKMSFDIVEKLNLQSAAMDFIVNLDNDSPVIVEISYGFTHDGKPLKKGYWDSDLRFHDKEFDPYGWIVETLIKNDTEQSKKKETIK